MNTQQYTAVVYDGRRYEMWNIYVVSATAAVGQASNCGEYVGITLALV